MSYEIELSPAAVRNLKDLEQKQRIEILEKIDLLQNDPAPPGAKKLRGYRHPTFRLRHGSFRIAYRLEKHRLVILVLAAGNRKDIYERLKRII